MNTDSDNNKKLQPAVSSPLSYQPHSEKEHHRLVYTVKKSNRSTRFKLTILCNGSIELTLPANASRRQAKLFFKNEEPWVREQLVHIHDKPCRSALNAFPNYKLHKETAREAVHK